MNSEKENSMNKGDLSDKTAKPQQTKYPDQRQPDYKTDSTQKNSGADQTKFDKQSQSDDRNKKDIDSERHSEEQVTHPKEFTKKDNTNYSDKSDRV